MVGKRSLQEPEQKSQEASSANSFQVSLSDNQPESTENDGAPTGMRLALIMVAILSAMFLVALVGHLQSLHGCSQTDSHIILGSYHYCHCNTQDLGRIPRHRRHWLVRERLPLDQQCNAAPVGSHLYFLSYQDPLPCRSSDL